MSADPRKQFSVKFCPRNKVEEKNKQSKRRDFLNNITKIGDIEGTGDVGKGLRNLSKVSNSIRTGADGEPSGLLGKIVSIPLNAVDRGATAVLDATGLREAAGKVLDFNPDTVNRAVGQAKGVFDSVKRGKFELEDIPNVFQDFQNLEQLGRGIFNLDKKPAKRDKFCGASPYAIDLIKFAPKFNFMFVMDVRFAPEYHNWTNIGDTMSFVVKRSQRPSVEFEYEDVNMYNFWTKVPKKTIYPPMTMTFYDDNKNAAHLFYTAYMRAMSPIANMKPTDPQVGEYELASMEFDKSPAANTFDGTVNTRGYAASLGPLIDDTTSIVQKIRLYHIFDYGSSMNIYNFYNPRISTFTPSELNMAESGDGAEFEFQFAYDGLFVEPGWDVASAGEGYPDVESLTNNSDTATYPIKPINGEEETKYKNSQQSLAPTAQKQQAAGNSQYGFGRVDDQ